MKKFSYALIAIASLCFSVNSFAGSNAKSQAKFTPDEITRFAKQVEKYAASQGARVFIIGRVGRPQKDLPEGVEFTHTAIAVYSAINLPDGTVAKGYAIHNLYQKENDLAHSELVVDYPADFFWSADSLRAGILIPTPELQQRLLNAFAQGLDQKVHIPNYSVLANPFNAQFQNCTEYTLDVINSAIYQTTDYAQLKANTRAYFHAQQMHINGLKLLLGTTFKSDIKTSDQKGKIWTATFSSIGLYLDQHQLLSQQLILEADGSRHDLAAFTTKSRLTAQNNKP